ncbi:MAG: hypothetical protein ACOC35_02360 [Promethearchaeia archaeon]
MTPNLKQYVDFRLMGLFGSILIIISQFLPWLTNFSLLNIYILQTTVAIEDAFFYLFPVISGVLCLIGALILYYDKDYRINAVIVFFIGLGFLLLFLFDFIPSELQYLPNIGIGFYFCIAGFIMNIFYTINILITKE